MCEFGWYRNWVANCAQWRMILNLTCKTVTVEGLKSFVRSFNQVPGLLLKLKVINGTAKIGIDNWQAKSKTIKKESTGFRF